MTTSRGPSAERDRWQTEATGAANQEFLYYSKYDGKVSQASIARTTDVSLGGCYIESIGQVTIGEHIRFEIQLPAGSWMPLRGEVLYHHPNLGFGVQFIELTGEAQTVLACMIGDTGAAEQP